MRLTVALAAAIGTLMTTGTGLARSPDPNSTNWGMEKSELTSTPEFGKSKAICRRVMGVEPPERDQPTPAQAKALKGCNSEKLYYGEGARPDYVEARLCAFAEMAGPDDNVFGGSTVLMQVYANGLGVPRNLDLATDYACRLDGAPAENDGRVLSIQALKTKPEHFDYCDDVTSGAGENVCQARDSHRAAIDRNARLEVLTGRLPPRAKALYAPMKKAFNAFVDAHGDGEVDLSGSAHGAEEDGEQDALRDQFAKDLEGLLAGHWPSAADAKAADAQLNVSYRQATAWAAGKTNDTTIKAEDVRAAERAWLAYRDAFARFSAAAAPAVSQEAVLTHLARLRTKQLDQLHT